MDIPSLIQHTAKQAISNHQIHLPTDSFKNFIETNLRIDSLHAGASVTSKELKIEADPEDFCIFMRNLGLVSEYSNNSSSVMINHSKACMIYYSLDDRMIKVTIYGIETSVGFYTQQIESNFSAPKCYIKWIYDPQYMESMIIPVPTKHQPFSEMYPFLGEESLNDYYDRFVESDSSILLLIGPPGTGKTSFLRGLLLRTEQNAILTYHTKLLEQDAFFADWLRKDDDNIVIIEDSDTMLDARSEGNTMMHRFLNLGDGLISIPGKKMIFTTNLPSIDSIDAALTRPGRCHDILHFKPLTRQQADVVARKGNTTISTDQEEYTIAEIFNDLKTRKNPNIKSKKMGFT